MAFEPLLNLCEFRLSFAPALSAGFRELMLVVPLRIASPCESHSVTPSHFAKAHTLSGNLPAELQTRPDYSPCFRELGALKNRSKLLVACLSGGVAANTLAAFAIFGLPQHRQVLWCLYFGKHVTHQPLPAIFRGKLPASGYLSNHLK